TLDLRAIPVKTDSATNAEGERGRRVAARHGNIVSHEPASDSSTVQNVLGFIQDYVPQAVTGAKVEKKGKVLWAHFETAPLNEPGRCTIGGGGGGEGRGVPDARQDPLLLIVGVASGFSVWHIPPAGDAREVYCCYGDGETARTARLVPTPDPCLQGSDQFAHLRPILAVVKKGRLGGGIVPYSTLQLLSLSATDADTLVKKFQFKGKPILGLHSNQRVLAVVFRRRVLVIDSSSLAVRFYVRNDYPLEHVVNPVALGSRWLALTETKLSARYSSRGGVCLTQLPSVTTTVIKNVRKGLSAISDTISGLTGMVQSNPDPSDSPPLQTAEHLTANVVTVLDTSYDHPEELRLHEAGRKVGGVVAHFQATAEHGSHIAALTFDPSGTLLVTASTEGHLFNVFRLVPHPWLSSKSAVTHLYTLFRGATSASVHDIVVSCDSRWVAVSTLNGTSHLFPITPYGGEMNVRTHTRNKVVNRMSRFHTSAGIEIVATRTHSHSAVTPPPSTVSSSPTSHTSHSPPHHERDLLTSSPRPLGWNNPRTTPPSLPLTVRALYQIKQPYLSSDERSKVSVGVASGGGGHAHSSPHPSAGEPWPGESQCVRVLFSPSSLSSSPSPSSSSGNTSGAREWSSAEVSPGSAGYTVFVLGGSGTLTRYSLLPRPHEEAREGDDAPIAIDCHAHFSWRLLSKPHPLTMKLPLPEDNPLILSASAVQRTSELWTHGRSAGLLRYILCIYTLSIYSVHTVYILCTHCLYTLYTLSIYSIHTVYILCIYTLSYRLRATYKCMSSCLLYVHIAENNV
ncbi:Breast carcinoma-amplified sequence 3 homolog, partial [Geodia barretti]